VAKVIGRNARILLGNRNVSPDTNQTTLTLSAEAPECTGFCDDYKVRLIDGVRDEELSVDGFYNTSISTMDDIMATSIGGSALTALYFTGLAGSNFGREFVGVVSSYDPKFAVADAGGVSFTVSGCSALYHMASLSGSSVDSNKTPKLSAAGASTLGSVDLGVGAAGCPYTATIRVLSMGGTNPVFCASLQASANDSAFTTVYVASGILPAHIGNHSASLVTITSASRYMRITASLAGTAPCANFVIAVGSARTT
jgi:hypothetical protein